MRCTEYYGIRYSKKRALEAAFLIGKPWKGSDKQAGRQAGKQASRRAGEQASRQTGKQANRQWTKIWYKDIQSNNYQNDIKTQWLCDLGIVWTHMDCQYRPSLLNKVLAYESRSDRYRSNPAVTTAIHPILGVDCSLRWLSPKTPSSGMVQRCSTQKRRCHTGGRSIAPRDKARPPTQQDQNSNSIKFQHLAPAKNFQCRVSLLAIKSVRPILRAWPSTLPLVRVPRTIHACRNLPVISCRWSSASNPLTILLDPSLNL